MNSQLYTATSGLINEQRRLDLISNNLANASTSGFRSQRLFSSVYSQRTQDAPASVHAANTSVAPAGAYSVPGPGPVRVTGRDLDIALSEGDLLSVRTAGGVRYTRAGSLNVSSGGQLTDMAGNPVLNAEQKPIDGLTAGTAIAADGRVLVDGVETGRVGVVRDPRGVLIREGDGLLSARGRDAAMEPVKEPKLMSGWLEGSGTNALVEMVNLIEAQRAFESYQKIISLTMNEVNRRAVNDLAG